MAKVERPGWSVPRSGHAGGDTVGEFCNFGLGSEGEASTVHSQNAPGVGGLGGAAEDQRRGKKGTGEGEFFSDEIALGVGAVGEEVGVVAEAVLVAGGGEGKIGNSRLADRVSTRKDREGGGERRVKRRRWGRLRGCFFVTLNPRELASGVQHHGLDLRWGTNGKVHD